jgi:phosphohistidine phosphatase
MDLILWRHAEAEPGDPDVERRLTAKGAKHAARVARWLDGRLPGRCRILVSPARRAQQTAQALDRKFRTSDALSTGAAPQAILAAANWPDARETVLVVGHQPTLGRVAALLLADEDLEWSISKGALWWLSNRERSRGPAVALRVVIGPDFV